jgi:hypothetical protein
MQDRPQVVSDNQKKKKHTKFSSSWYAFAESEESAKLYSESDW